MTDLTGGGVLSPMDSVSSTEQNPRPIMSMIQGGIQDAMDTHEGEYYRAGFTAAMDGMTARGVIVDPFARNCEWGTLTNDIDPDTKAAQHLDAVDFLKTIPDRCADVVLFDPPFSPNQAERYGVGMSNIYTDGKYVSQCMKEIERVLKTGGRLLKLGYNSCRHRPTFRLQRVWLVNFGGNRNDVIMTLWGKSNHTLDEWGVIE